MTNGRRDRDRASHKKISEQEKRLVQQAKAQQEAADKIDIDTRHGSPKTATNPVPERPTKSAHRSLAQKRAKHALRAIQKISGHDFTWESNYVS